VAHLEGARVGGDAADGAELELHAVVREFHGQPSEGRAACREWERAPHAL